MVFFSLSTQLWLVLAILIVVGACNTAYSATANTMLQTRAPGAMRGRVMSYNTIALIGLTPLGGAIIGGIAEVAGTRAALVMAGLVVAACAVLIYTLLPHLRAAKYEEQALQEAGI
jgi:MFS family permease